MNMKKKFDPFFIFACVILIGILGFFIYFIFNFIIEIIGDISELIKNFSIHTFWAIIFTIVLLLLIIYVVNNWERRDDFFLFIVSILNSPLNYIYEKRKNKLINYRDEVKELTEYIKYFSIIISKGVSNEEFLLFVEKVKDQNELLEKNREKLEKEDSKINLFIQVFFLLCGVVTTLFF